MTTLQITGPYPIFTDLDGTPLDDGYIFIGDANDDPETNPQQVYWDANLTIPATQPIRTSNGYAYRNGSPALIYTSGDFSITIRNKRNEFVLYSPVGYGFDPGAISAQVVVSDFTGDGVTTIFGLSATPSTQLATSVYINGVYQEKNTYTVVGNTLTFSIAPPLSSSIEVVTNETGVISGGTNANLVTYTAGFVGAVQQTVQSKLEQYVSVKDFGAVGDGVTDDTAAIQAALDTGKTIYVPATDQFYLLTATVTLDDNQIIFGDGAGSQLRMTPSSSVLNVISATNKTNVTISNLQAYASGANPSTILSSGGIALLDCTYSTVENCSVQNHRGSGVILSNSNNCKIRGNTFLNSPVQDGDTSDLTGADVYLTYSSSNNVVTENICKSGNATGIALQSILAGDKVNDNVVSNNIIQNCKAYGIYVYKVNATGEADRNAITGNSIYNITGTVINLVTGQYNFGSGIYLQGAEYCTVVGNTLEKTHSGSVIFTELLAPGAIGMTNAAAGVISGNSINDPKQFGIYVADPNSAGVAGGFTVIADNVVTNAPNRGGIKILQRGNVLVRDNAISNVNGLGIWVANTVTQRENITINGNQISTTTAASGAQISFAQNCMVANNQIIDAGNGGIFVEQSSIVSVKDNTIVDQTNRGIQIASTVSNCTVTGNTIKGTGASTEGIRVDTIANLTDNRVSGCVLALTGTGANFIRVLPVNSATPSVTDGKQFSTANTLATTITNFSGALDGQEIDIYFTDNNTTLKFSGVTNLRGNASVDRLMAIGDSIRAVYRQVPGSTSWAVTIIEA